MIDNMQLTDVQKYLENGGKTCRQSIKVWKS